MAGSLTVLSSGSTTTTHSSSIPACYSTPCAPCYIDALPSVMTFPEPFIIQDETYTIDVLPHITQLPNGTISTIYKTLGTNASTMSDLQLREKYTWVENNMTLTYPTTYIWFGDLIHGWLTSDQALQTKTPCSLPSKATDITLPLSADPSSLVVVVGTSYVDNTNSDQEPSSMPASILGYLDSLPEVRGQFDHIPITSCAYLIDQPDVCTSIVVSTSTSCVSGSGNLSHTSCNEEHVTVTTTLTAETKNSPVLHPAHPSLTLSVSRRSAAYLTYNTLATSAAVVDHLQPTVTPTPTPSRIGQTHTGSALKEIPSNAAGGGSSGDSKPTENPSETAKNHSDIPGDHNSPSEKATPPQDSRNAPAPSEATQAAESQSQDVQSAIGALTSLAVASQNQATATASEGNTHASGTASAGDGKLTPGGAIETHETESVGNLLSALQSVASQAAATIPPDSFDVHPHSSTEDTEPQTGAENPGHAGKISNPATATGSSVFGTISSVLPVFTFQGQTLTAGDAVTFGGSAVSQLQNQEGVVIDHDHTVLLSDGEATTLHPQTNSQHQSPITLARSGSAFIVNSQTLQPNKEITAGKITASASVASEPSAAIVYINGTPTSISVGRTTDSSTDDESSTPPSTNMGGYIYSGIGGAVTSGGSSEKSSESATGGGGAAASSTGEGSRLGLWSWSYGGSILGFTVFLGGVCLL